MIYYATRPVASIRTTYAPHAGSIHQYNMKFTQLVSFVAVASASHDDHDHSSLKPTGPYYGILSSWNKANTKNWNNMEVQMTFGESTLDLLWWFGIKNPMIPSIPKQIFSCSGVKYTFDETSLHVVINPDADRCLAAINGKFPKSLGIANPFNMPVDHDTGDVRFAVAGGAIYVDLYAIDTAMVTIPSGVDGRAPLSVPARRKAAGSASAAAPGPKAAETTLPAAVDPSVKSVTTTTTKSAFTGSILVSACVVALAGLIL